MAASSGDELEIYSVKLAGAYVIVFFSDQLVFVSSLVPGKCCCMFHLAAEELDRRSPQAKEHQMHDQMSQMHDKRL